MVANYVWYAGLVFLSLIMIFYTLRRAQNNKLVVLLFGMIGLGYFLENIMYVFLNSYTYDPGILENDYYDSHLGAVASNVFSLPAIAVLIAGLSLSLGWLIAFAAMFTGIEWAFLKLGIYEHHWWRLSFTFVAFPVYFWVAKVWLDLIEIKGRHLLVIFLTLLSSAYFARMSFEYVGYALIGSHDYTIGWFDNPYRDNSAFTAVHCLLIALVIVLVYTYRRGRHNMIKLCLLSIFMLLDLWTLKSLDIYQWKTYWDIVYALLSIWLAYMLIDWLHRRMTG